jgi:hypothetical protein
MDLLTYQRTVFAFHGCDRRVADSVLSGKSKLSASTNTYDWLGTGIYFWEHGPARALEWAEAQARRKGTKIKKPAVLGAIIQLGNCFDLLDVRFTRELAAHATALADALNAVGRKLPENQSAGMSDFDWLRRDRDCFVLNSIIPHIETKTGKTYQTVRGVFQEGETAFPGAGIKLKSHIQLAVRDPRAIIGYFRPESTS